MKTFFRIMDIEGAARTAPARTAPARTAPEDADTTET